MKIRAKVLWSVSLIGLACWVGRAGDETAPGQNPSVKDKKEVPKWQAPLAKYPDAVPAKVCAEKFRKDAVGAGREFQKKRIALGGDVTDIPTADEWTTSIVLDDCIVCLFRTDEAGNVDKLTKGQSVVITGYFSQVGADGCPNFVECRVKEAL
jgi:hypothetical protein